MMVKPRGCCDRNAQVLTVALRDPVIPLDAKLNKSSLRWGASVATNSSTSAQFSDRVEKDFSSRP